jgi:hypothetical protein
MIRDNLSRFQLGHNPTRIILAFPQRALINNLRQPESHAGSYVLLQPSQISFV